MSSIGRNMDSLINFYDLSLKDLQALIAGQGKEKFRAEQLYRWVFKSGIQDFDQMSNLSKDFRTELKDKFKFLLPTVQQQLDSVDGTRKFLVDVSPWMNEGASQRAASLQTVEAVLIPSDDRLTLCMSSEVGCAMGCKFCFTGKQGLIRRLNAAEIVGQFILAQRSLEPGQRITNIVFMGMGEPMDNAESVFKAIDILCDPMGMNFSRRKITVSTSGIVPNIKLVAENRVRLAVSLNATIDEIRDHVMPINKKWNLAELMKSCRDYYSATRERITFEYVLLKGVNDSLEDARRIVRLTKGIPCKINLIPFNEHPGSGFDRPGSREVGAFQNLLIQLGMHVLVRKTMGRDIYAACGQLRSAFENHPKTLPLKPISENTPIAVRVGEEALLEAKQS